MRVTLLDKLKQVEEQFKNGEISRVTMDKKVIGLMAAQTRKNNAARLKDTKTKRGKKKARLEKQRLADQRLKVKKHTKKDS